VADEIDNANVVRLVKDGDRWCALIGPDPQRGLMGTGLNPVSALVNLTVRCAKKRWPFDDSWKPGKTRLHDA
jgi:hypothetical protein